MAHRRGSARQKSEDRHDARLELDVDEPRSTDVTVGRPTRRKSPIMRASLLACGLAFLLLTAAAAPSYGGQASGDASAFVAELAQKALRSGSDRTLSAGDRQRTFEKLLDEDFDLPRIARFVLGHYWQEAKDSERQEFVAVFRDYMVRAYTARFTEFNGESFRVIRQRVEGGTGTLVSTEIARSATGQVVKVEWRVASGDGYKVLDMSIDGMSMALVQREEFASAMQRSGAGVPSLIRLIRSSAQQSR
jgi:phospholipid transport system substrate-binding protein